MKKNVFFFYLIFLILPLQTVFAHRIGLFAYVEEEKIQGQVYFVDGTPAKKAQVKLMDLKGKVLASTLTDQQGKFFFKRPVTKEGPLRIVALAEAGHRTEMILHLNPKTEDGSYQKGSSVFKNSSLSREEISSLVRKEVQKELEPIKNLLEEILKELKKPSFHEIISGFGYIIGFFGLLFWIKSKR